MIENTGEKKEALMIEAINGKKYIELSENSKRLVSKAFPEVFANDVIKAGMVDDYIKPDFYIEHDGEKKYISMKSGVNNIVHQEYIQDFCAFLNSLGISKRTTDTILKFHYGDGTTDGSARENLKSDAEIRKELEKDFVLANEELNKDRLLVVRLVNRFVFKGKNPENIITDFIYHGEVDFGQTVSRRQVLRHVEIKRYDFYKTLHIGPILFRPHARYYKKPVRREVYRQRVEFYWPNMYNDFIYINGHYIA